MQNSETVGVLDELTKAECLELLASQEFGRLAVIVDDQPLIFPVNYALDGEAIIFRNDPGTKLTNASLNRVAFEVDAIDRGTKGGWSVVVSGTAREFTEAIDEISERELRMPLTTWAAGDKGHWVRIFTPTITGRRLRQVTSMPDVPVVPGPS